jgi:phospholipid transport system substrate-binding protein
MRNPTRFLALALAALPLGVAAVPAAPAAAQARQLDPAGQFIDQLADQAFAVLREKQPRPAVRAKFRQMLRENFMVAEIGDRLIRRHRAQITPAQLIAYRAAFPDYVINTYADRLYDYANADLKVIRTIPRGQMVDVMTRITKPGISPIDSTWSVRRLPNGKYQIANLTVAGVNLVLTQEADFSSYIQRNGFDKLVEFMRQSGDKA